MKSARLLGALCAVLLSFAPARAAEQASYVTPTAGPMSMATFAGTYLNPGLRALAACSWGTSAPMNGPSSAALPYQCWADTTSNPVLFKRYDGASWVVWGALDTTTHAWTPYRQGVAIGTASIATTGTSGHTLGFLDGANTYSAIQSGATAAVDTNTTQFATTAFVLGQAASATPLIDGTAAVGTSTRFARGDHVHPTDTTRAPLASPTFTGTPAAPTAAVDTSTTQLATTAFVIGQAASATPLINGTAAAGSSTRFARGDHVHPTDTTRAPLASPALTGTPTAPTASPGTNTTQLATTAYADAIAALKANLASPTFTGTPAAPTAAPGTNTTQLASTAFVQAAVVSATTGVSSLNGQTGALVATYAPQGRITPVSGNPAPTTDQAGVTILFYDATGAVGKQVPIYNNSSVVMVPLCAANTAGTCNTSITLGSNWAANTVFDLFAYNNSGVVGLCTVAYSNSAAGTGSRATALQAFDSFQTNATLATCRTTNAATTSCAVNQCTWLGAFLTNGNAGQVDLKFGSAAAGGGPAVFGICNGYNQVPAVARVVDTNASWTTGNGNLDSGGAGAGANNRITVLSCNGTLPLTTQLYGRIQLAANGSAAWLTMGINLTGLAQTTNCSRGIAVQNGTQGLDFTAIARCDEVPALGMNFIQAMQSNSGAQTIVGGSADERLVGQWAW